MSLEIIKNRIKIDKYDDGFRVTIKCKNWTKIGEYSTPCFILYHNRIIELHNDYLIAQHGSIFHKYEGDDFHRLLPSILEHGEMQPRSKEVN